MVELKCDICKTVMKDVEHATCELIVNNNPILIERFQYNTAKVRSIEYSVNDICRICWLKIHAFIIGMKENDNCGT